MSDDDRRTPVDVERLIPRDDDPPAEPGFVLKYVRPVTFADGTKNRTCLRFPSGKVVVIL